MIMIISKLLVLILLIIRLNLLQCLDINDILKTNTSNNNKVIDSCNVDISIIDISSLKMGIMYRDKNHPVIKSIRQACTETGFFYIKGHNVPLNLINYLEKLSRDFFALDKDKKNEISMDKGGSSWRGYFSVGEEFTSNIPDQKEGIYFGTQGDPLDERPLHGVNLYPNDDIKEAVETYMRYMKQLGELLMKAIVLSLGLNDYTFVDTNFQKQPTELFRIFSYPPHDPQFGENSLAVGTHTDYGYITILWQDNSGGLEVKPKGCNFRKDYWIDAPPVEGTFIINLGDALEHFTGGYYTSTPHRVKRRNADNLRISFPYFYDPTFDTPMNSILSSLSDDIQKDVAARKKLGEWSSSRWDGEIPTNFEGTYGEYLQKKISKVFPNLYNQKIKVKNTDIKSRFFNLINKEETAEFPDNKVSLDEIVEVDISPIDRDHELEVDLVTNEDFNKMEGSESILEESIVDPISDGKININAAAQSVEEATQLVEDNKMEWSESTLEGLIIDPISDGKININAASQSVEEVSQSVEEASQLVVEASQSVEDASISVEEESQPIEETVIPIEDILQSQAPQIEIKSKED